MYAIVEIAGQQFKVTEKQLLYVHRQPGNEGDNINFEKVMLVNNNGSIKVGKPVVSGASVSAKIISHIKGDKVLVFKKKRRKAYQKMNGHRQQFSRIQIESIKA
ncbi:MAG: 50S ribosomal protein L21 [Bacteroidia bacterium]|nr:50S ribosomal protein L21 [Bacteroidia bacterium]MCZ2278029.1 50S ribosomal protein L21 [Bacteroidia bacterium]